MQELIVCSGRGRFRTQVDPAEISTLRTDAATTVWLDLTAPSAHELALLQDEFGFHPLAIEDATRRHERPKVDSYGAYYFVVFYSLAWDATTGHLVSVPLNLFIGSNYLVTVHTAPVQQLADTLARWQAPNSPLDRDVGGLIYALLDAVVDDYFPLMDQLAERVEDLEAQMFAHYEEGTLQAIFQLKKELLQMRRVVAPERDVLNVMLRRDIAVFDQKDVTYLQDVYDHVVRVTDAIDTYRDLLASALDTFLSVQSNRLNQVVKALTVTSIILMSVTLVAGIYGMNFDYMPELHWRYGYAWALGLMVVIAGAVLAVFRRMKWL